MGVEERNPWRVFLSHTSEFRNFPQGGSYIAAVERAVSKAGHAIVDMVDFAAQDQEPAKVCEERVQASDIYMGIFGSRYGSPVRDRPEVSYTELEFNTATAAGIPRLVFLLDDEAENPGIPGKWLRDNAHGSRQEAFLKRVQDAGLTLSRFRNPDDLRACVYRALQEEAQRRQRQNLDLNQKGAPNPSGWTWPGAWDFSGYLREKRQGFIGRRWLFDAVRAWYSNPAASQALLIVADFGVGNPPSWPNSPPPARRNRACRSPPTTSAITTPPPPWRPPPSCAAWRPSSPGSCRPTRRRWRPIRRPGAGWRRPRRIPPAPSARR
jgi:hypothetical protein